MRDTPDPDPTASGSRRGIRVGLALDPLDTRGWVVGLAARLEAEDATVALIVEVGGGVAAWVGPQAGPLERLLVRLDDRIFGRPKDALARIDPRKVWPDVPRVAIPAAGSSLGDAPLPPEVAGALEAANLDVIVQPCGRPLGSLAGLARFGLWTFHHGERDGWPTGTPGLEDVLRGRDASPSELVALTPDGARHVLYRTWSTPDATSVRRSMNRILTKTAEFPGRVLGRLAAADGESLASVAIGPDPRAGGAGREPDRTDRTDGTAATAAVGRAILRALGPHVGRFARRFIDRKVRPERWILAELTDVPLDRMPDPRSDAARLLHPPGDDSWADPFPVENEGRDYLFVEEWTWAVRKGRISVLDREVDGSWGPARPVLELDVHLSYPFVFEWQGDWYLMPESSSGRTLDLYRATTFPDLWAFDRRVLDGVRVADATIAQIDGGWWLFATLAPDGAPLTDELHLFSGPGPLGPWTAHRANPVVSDVRRARPAGRLFKLDGAWYRPSQDCSGTYGRALVISRIERIDPGGYAETVVDRFEPDWLAGGLATHTLNRVGRSVLLDVSVAQRRLR